MLYTGRFVLVESVDLYIWVTWPISYPVRLEIVHSDKSESWWVGSNNPCFTFWFLQDWLPDLTKKSISVHYNYLFIIYVVKLLNRKSFCSIFANLLLILQWHSCQVFATSHYKNLDVWTYVNFHASYSFYSMHNDISMNNSK